jgi:DNA invertase Pin-like site-specific DNA recombinase
MNETKRAAIYVRVSTVEQGTDLQETELSGFANHLALVTFFGETC